MVLSFRQGLYSLLLLSFDSGVCHNILPCERTATPLTELDVRISLIRLFSMFHSAADGQKNLCAMCVTGNG